MPGQLTIGGIIDSMSEPNISRMDMVLTHNGKGYSVSAYLVINQKLLRIDIKDIKRRDNAKKEGNG